MDFIFSFALKNRERIISCFKFFYLTIVIVIVIGGRSIYYTDKNSPSFYSLALLSGKLGLLFYILTTIPGIARRFGLKHKLLSLLHVFRRYIGILMFLLTTLHFWFIKGITIFIKGIISFPPLLFEITGLTAFLLTFFLFLTSNDISLKRLGRLWFKIHKLTYIIVFFIFLHLILQRLSIWTILISLTLVIQISSHVYLLLKSKSI